MGSAAYRIPPIRRKIESLHPHAPSINLRAPACTAHPVRKTPEPHSWTAAAWLHRLGTHRRIDPAPERLKGFKTAIRLENEASPAENQSSEDPQASHRG